MTDSNGNGPDGRDPNRTQIRRASRKGTPRPGGRDGSGQPVRTIVRTPDSQTRSRPTDRNPPAQRDARHDTSSQRHREPPTRPVAVPRRPRTELRSPETPTEGADSQPRANRLLDEASSLLALGGFLLTSDKPADLTRLRGEIHDAVTRYLENIQGHYSDNTVNSAGFCLCAFIDDCVLRTIWGQESPWRESTILATVYKTAQRHDLGQQIQDDIRRDADPDLFALYHTIFSLGYVGITGDEQDTLRLREDVYQKMRSNGHQESLSLISASMIRAREGEPLARRIPWWAVLAGCAAVLLLTFFGFRSLLQPSVENYYAQLDALTDQHKPLTPEDFFPDRPPPPPVALPRIDLEELLIEAGLAAQDFELVAAEPGTRVILRADGMFNSGSANLEPQILPILAAIGDALTQTKGQIIVEGHTDNVPFSSGLRTNRSLSKERSEAVSNVLAGQLGGRERLSARGRAALAPIVCNDSADNRRRNRRVEIVLPEIDTFGARTIPTPVCDGAR